MHGTIDSTRDIETLNEDQESEYVGDSECGTDLSDHFLSQKHGFSESQRLNPLDSGGESEYKYKSSESYLRHPNSYLPHYNIHTDTDTETLTIPLNGGCLGTLVSDEDEEEEEEDDDDNVVPYGFPSSRRNRCLRNRGSEIGAVIKSLEETNSLLPGANSNSDLSTNLCEIDDSEFEITQQKSNGRAWITGGVTQTSV